MTKNQKEIALRVGFRFFKKPFPHWIDPQGFRTSEGELIAMCLEYEKLMVEIDDKN